ncbi:hypothetical protein MM221_13320 [Salipaludibacillus sp. LMS25]|jgi:hypothetical protein|uniref:hypothetical protein n=1 Tax=Salipaludibacillus sp. LMS25 TaxID=2924031 RepID=UPI0020D1115B|nr:hypothetical protein [Salipaludibacillus sp. LMS25]UTR13599.1 hypothetical protein MM221_13320 [Salipaludibacillus sp. LMS25]
MMTETNQSMAHPHENTLLEPQVPVVTVKEWIVTLILAAVPLLNIIMLFVWAFSQDSNPNKANLAKASLVLAGIVFSLYFFFSLLILIFSM